MRQKKPVIIISIFDQLAFPDLELRTIYISPRFFVSHIEQKYHHKMNRQHQSLMTLLPLLLLTAASAAADPTYYNQYHLPPTSTIPTTGAAPHHALLRSSCSTTRYPDLCFSAVAAIPNAAEALTTQKDVIEASINLTCSAVQRNFFTVERLLKGGRRRLTKREVTALHDCLETIDETLDELHVALRDLNEYPNKKPLTQHAADLETLLSAAMTNQETCLDGFSHDGADKRVRAALLQGQTHVEHMCSNSLAMIINMTESDIQNDQRLNQIHDRKAMEYPAEFSLAANREETPAAEEKWPEWVSAGDRRLLQAAEGEEMKPNVVVAADGSGDYATVMEAVAAAPNKSKERFIIKIKAGVYRENVEVTKGKTNLMFLGEGRATTIITASRSVADGFTTFKSATVAVVGQGFLARDITFQNTAGPQKHQAVALRVGADLAAFYNCDILAYQDTLYVHSNRQFFINCLIAGTVDFIFGNAAVVLQDCDIHARLPGPGQKNMITAQGRKDPNQNTGIVIQKSRIGATSDLLTSDGNFPTYLGRPWKEFSRTVIMQSEISDVVHSSGWHEWNGEFALATLFYREFENSGPGANTSDRVRWEGYKVMSNVTEAEAFAADNFIAGGSWLRPTRFPFSLGL
ncbi:Pectinesterase 3 [Linum grandiflorum]